MISIFSFIIVFVTCLVTLKYFVDQNRIPNNSQQYLNCIISNITSILYSCNQYPSDICFYLKFEYTYQNNQTLNMNSDCVHSLDCLDNYYNKFIVNTSHPCYYDNFVNYIVLDLTIQQNYDALSIVFVYIFSVLSALSLMICCTVHLCLYKL